MKITHLFPAFCLMFLIACGENKEAQTSETESSTTEEVVETTEETVVSEEVTETGDPSASGKGIGPVTSLELPAEVDAVLAGKGKTIFETKCTVCHITDKKLIGPALKGILNRRMPEWVMNMILNPAEMTQKDPTAMALFKEFGNVPMTDSGLTEEEARSVLEYIRSI